MPDRRLTERDNLLITYGDQVTEAGRPPLAVLTEFLERHVGDIVTGVHLLPHFPYSSDDGFSVIDHRRVDPALGTWDDVGRLGRRFNLMLDAVINHVSRESAWFQAYRRGEAPYRGYFIECEPGADISMVVRPRALPLLTPVETARGTRHVWTTFSDDQIDLNFRNPDVLMEIIDILLMYVSRGARLLRLDAIAYLWKELGTPCIHLPQTHQVIQLIRAVLDLVAPGTLLVTETNVPHRDNVGYFGDGTNEAHMVYNFSLPPLVLDALRGGSAEALSGWAAGVGAPTDGTTFLNFLASHDGIGLNPARGILSESAIASLARELSPVSFADGPDGVRRPYELNVNFRDAVGGNARPFLVAQAIMLALRGVPGIYFHSLFGSRGWPEGVRQTGRNRTINRQKFTRLSLEKAVADPASGRAEILGGCRSLLRARAASAAFDPYAPQRVLDCGGAVFGLIRTSADGSRSVFCLHNVSPLRQTVRLDTGRDPMHDLISGRSMSAMNVELEPHEAVWLTGEP